MSGRCPTADGLSRFLAPHVHACQTADYVVLLDIKRNEFMGLSYHDADILLDSLRSTAPRAGERSALEMEMQSLGMLAPGGARTCSHRIAPPRTALFEEFVPFAVPISIGMLVNAALAFSRARLAVTSGNVERCVRKSAARARRLERLTSCCLERLERAVASYIHCRAWLSTTAEKCLVDSLALHDFLSRYGIASSLVIGVRTSPFGAHAWVQQGSIVLNDQCEIVRAYECTYASAP